MLPKPDLLCGGTTLCGSDLLLLLLLKGSGLKQNMLLLGCVHLLQVLCRRALCPLDRLLDYLSTGTHTMTHVILKPPICVQRKGASFAVTDNKIISTELHQIAKQAQY